MPSQIPRPFNPVNRRRSSPETKLALHRGYNQRRNFRRMRHRRDTRLKRITSHLGIAIITGGMITPEESFTLLYGHGNRSHSVIWRAKRLEAIMQSNADDLKTKLASEMNPDPPVRTLKADRRGEFGKWTPDSKMLAGIWDRAVQEYQAAVTIGQIKAANGQWGYFTHETLSSLAVIIPRRFKRGEYLVRLDGGFEIYSINYAKLFRIPLKGDGR